MVETIQKEWFHFFQASGSGLTLKLAVIFRHLVKGGSFPAC